MVNQESLNTHLATQARQAYELKRTRESIALAKQLAEADPGNVEAQSILSAIRADIQQDLHDARALIEQFGNPDEKRKYRKAAEIILIKTLSIDPENVEASMLLQSARAVPAGSMPRAQKQAPAPQPSINVPQLTPKEDEVPFVAGSTLFENYKEKEKKKFRLKLPIGLIAVVVLGGGLIRVALSHRTSPDALAAPAATAESTHPINYKPRTETPAPKPAPAPASPAPVAAAVTPPVAVPDPAATPAVPMGVLSVNSATPAEIYQGEKRLGTTPATLRLPAGRQTLEYRHGDLKTFVNHTVKANETTNASITFQVVVQINAKPWAQVFVDGSPRRALGQTPLSGVSVPVGGVLVFENPNFTSKTYRITDKETAIQVDFN
jgi:hypothetical protein